jgi:hypothetical protein
LPPRAVRGLFPGMSIKEQVLSAIQKLPDDIDFRDVAEEIALLSAVEQAEEDIRGKRLVSNEQMKTRIEGWIAR